MGMDCFTNLGFFLQIEDIDLVEFSFLLRSQQCLWEVHDELEPLQWLLTSWKKKVALFAWRAA